MYQTQQKKRQTAKIIISEILMVLAVLLVVGVLVFIVSGYWVNEDFEVERQGMIQVSSVPTGADVVIDGIPPATWFERTNMSKIIASGEHQITVQKTGYDTWSKTINVSEGLLYRLHYPRLFLTTREKEPTISMANFNKAIVSPKHDQLVVVNLEQDYQLINLKNDTLQPKALTAAELEDLFDDWEAINNDKDLYDKNGNIVLKFYEDKYTVTLIGNHLSVIKNASEEEVLAADISFTPEYKKIGHSGEFIVMNLGSQMATLDMESMSVREWTAESPALYWLDNDMLGVIADGKLIAYDYDGQNRRELATGVNANFPAMITDDKYLYYVSDGVLVREWLIAR